MPRISLILVILATTALTACSSGNVKSASDYDAPTAPPVIHPLYDPYMPYASANATWAAPIYNKAGTIVRASDPNAERGREPYEEAPWATGAAARNALAPPGTF